MPDFNLAPDEEALLDEARKKFESAEQRRKPYESKWNHFYSLFRSYSDFRSDWTTSAPRDRDQVIGDAQDTWGADLFIPYCFSVIETILPRMLSNRPRPLILPRDRASEQNVENMKALIDSQQERIRYEIKLQRTAKSGLIYGLGVGKTMWRTDYRMRPSLMPGTTSPWVVSDPSRVLTFDDPDYEHIDIFDFFWDPFGYDLNAGSGSCDWAIHRTWRNTKYVMERINAGEWRGLSEEDVRSMGPSGKYDEAVQERMNAAGLRSGTLREDQPHEVWELHDGEKVITVLDRQVPVRDLDVHEVYWHGELPFQGFRPTESGLRELCGIGEIEPIEHLQREMNTLRSQRRDNAALKLQQVFAYADGFVEQGDLQFFPGSAIPTGGEPRDLLFPINVGDIPNSGYQEEANLQADIERVTGISDPVSGTGDASQTATGVQLVQAAANVRIQNKTRRLEAEVVKDSTRQMGSLNQQKIRTNRDVRLPAPPEPGSAERRWAWKVLGPGELQGEFDYEPEGGSTAPENVPQMRQDAQIWMTLMGGRQDVDQQRVLDQVLRLMGVKQPKGWILQGPQIPPEIRDVLVEHFGGNQQAVDQVTEILTQADLAHQEVMAQSPNAQPAQNGAAPQPAQ